MDVDVGAVLLLFEAVEATDSASEPLWAFDLCFAIESLDWGLTRRQGLSLLTIFSVAAAVLLSTWYSTAKRKRRKKGYLNSLASRRYNFVTASQHGFNRTSIRTDLSPRKFSKVSRRSSSQLNSSVPLLSLSSCSAWLYSDPLLGIRATSAIGCSTKHQARFPSYFVTFCVHLVNDHIVILLLT